MKYKGCAARRSTTSCCTLNNDATSIGVNQCSWPRDPEPQELRHLAKLSLIQTPLVGISASATSTETSSESSLPRHSTPQMHLCAQGPWPGSRNRLGDSERRPKEHQATWTFAGASGWCSCTRLSLRNAEKSAKNKGIERPVLGTATHPAPAEVTFTTEGSHSGLQNPERVYTVEKHTVLRP